MMMNELKHGGSLHKMYYKTHSEEERSDRQGVRRTVSTPFVDRNAANNDDFAGSNARRPLMQLSEMAAALKTPEPSRTRTQPVPAPYRADELDVASHRDMSLERYYSSARSSPHDDDASKRVFRRWRRIVSPASSGHAWGAMDEADADNDPHYDHELCSSSWENTLIFEMSM